VRTLKERWGDLVEIIVDACQGRLSRERVSGYLEAGFWVVVTGSKFFAGPAFSGALLVPGSVSNRLARITTSSPRGLRSYAWAGHWPVRWKGLRDGLSGVVNVGAHLRWAAAIEEMRRYFAVPVEFRKTVLQTFASGVPELLADYDVLEPLPECRQPHSDWVDDGEMAIQTIFAFFVRKGDRLANPDECREIYASLNRNLVSATNSHNPGPACHIGQPVAIRTASAYGGLSDPAGALRIAADARFVYEAWCPAEAASVSRLQGQMQRVATALKRIALIANEELQGVGL